MTESRATTPLHEFEVRERADEDAAAPNYHRLYHGFPIADYWDQQFLELVGAHVSEGDRVLDLGCGPASLWPYWKRLPPLERLVGVDLSPRMIDEARRREPTAEFAVGRVHELPFENGAFDVVIASSVLHHVPIEHLDTGLREIDRVLDEHGRVVGREPSGAHELGRTPGWLSGAIMNFRHLAFRLTRSREYPEPPLGDHHRPFDVEEFIEHVGRFWHVDAFEQRFAFSSYVYRARSNEVARLARYLDDRLAARTGTMFHFAASKNYVTADDVARTVALAREQEVGSMTDEEFLAYLQAASVQLERLLSERRD